MKIYITGAEFVYSSGLYEIRYKDEIIDKTKDRWNALTTCLSIQKLEELLAKKASGGMYNNSSS